MPPALVGYHAYTEEEERIRFARFKVTGALETSSQSSIGKRRRESYEMKDGLGNLFPSYFRLYIAKATRPQSRRLRL